MILDQWNNYSEIEDFKEYYEFCNYAVFVVETDEDGEVFEYDDICFGIHLMPKDTVKFYLIPDRD